MNLTIDANILVNELARTEGISQSLLIRPELEMLYIAEYTWIEAMHVIENRFRA